MSFLLRNGHLSIEVREDLWRRRKLLARLPKLTESEQDLLWHIDHGYQLETDSQGSNPVLCRLNDDEVIRPVSANRNTIKALEERGLISPGKGREPLTMVWRLRNSGKK